MRGAGHAMHGSVWGGISFVLVLVLEAVIRILFKFMLFDLEDGNDSNNTELLKSKHNICRLSSVVCHLLSVC